MDKAQQRAADILTQWREIERAMQDPAVGEAALETLRAEAERLRLEYQEFLQSELARTARPNP